MEGKLVSREEWRRKYKVLLVYYIIYIQILTVFIECGTKEGNKLCFRDVFEESVRSK